jgi:hypothetical protein
MRKLTRLWPALERIPGLLTIPAFWEHFCGPDIAVIRPFLRATEMTGGGYPCGGRLDRPVCFREIVDYGSGEIVAVCRDQWKRCQDLPLSRRETIMHSLDVSALARAIARPLGFRWHPPVVQGHNTWSIGLAADGFGTDRQVILMAHSEQEQFRMALHELLVGIEEPFILLCPTASRKDLGVHETLARRRVRFQALEDHLGVDEAGAFNAIRAPGPDAGAELVVTPVAERMRVVKEFTVRSRCKVADIQKAAGVDESDFYKWRSGKLPDDYAASVRIEVVLRQGLSPRPAP